MSSTTTPCRDERRFFRVGNELFPPNNEVQFLRVTLALNDMNKGQSEWGTLAIYGREVVRLGERNPIPLSINDIVNRGLHTTQIRAIIDIDGEETIVGVGAGVRFSFPATTQVRVSLAVPIVPQGQYPMFGPMFPNNNGVIINPNAPSAYTTSPFPMPELELGVEPLPVYDSFVEAYYKVCRPPVGDRLARLSQQVLLQTAGDLPPPPPPNGDGDGDIFGGGV
jgi:hypothetical protein